MSDESSFFFCWPLREGAIFAGHFTSTVSMIACGLAFAVFFKESKGDEGHSKLVSFLVACYTIFYIAMSRGLVRGVKDDRRDKFVCWIIMSIATVVILSCGSVFVLILFMTGRFQESTLISFTVIGTTVLCIVVSAILVYCIWGVVGLWRLYGGGEVDVFE